MEEETENNISEGFDDNDDLLIGSIGGVDDEGIVNFLSDAIGQDVGTEVLREFSHSEAFAELLDVVTSSLIPSGATSRRESNQDSETTPDGVVDPNQSERIQVIPDGNEQLETVRSSQNQNTDKKASEEKVSNPLEDEDPKSCSRNTDETKGTAFPSDRKIQNRLKICLKTPVGGKKDKKPPKTKAVLKLIHPPDETTTMPDQSSHKNSPEIQQTKEITEKSVKTKKAYVKSIHRLHKKCMLVHCDKEFRKYSTMLKLNPCCVILCDLLSMGSAFRETNCLGGGGDASLSFVSVKNLVVISEENIDETHAAEEMKRKYFVKKLNPLKEDNTVQVSKSQLNEIAQHTDKLMNTAPQQSSTKTSDSVKKQDQNKEVQDLGTTIVNKVVSFDESKTKKTSKMNEVKITEVNLEDDDDDEEEEEELPRPIKSRHKSGDRHTRGLETEATSSTEYDAKDKSQFGRQRDKDDVRARKFDKFEYERKRKLTEKTGEKIKKEVKVVLKPEDPFKHGKTFTNSFKIPKKNTYDNYLKPDELKVSTPLAKQEIPRENLKFERFKKGLGEDKDSNAKKRDWIPRNKRFENRTKMDYDMPHSSDNKPQQLPQSDVLLEMEKTWEDEPEGEGSIFGDRSTDSPLPPLSEVQAGDLAVEVTELLRDGLKTEVPSMEDFSCATDSTAQKCAWWFTKAEKEPPSEGDCHMQNLEAAPSFSSDNGSNCSFVGNVSNPGTDDADCQVNEISSTNRCDLVSERVRDPDKVDEYCGRSLLQAKIRIGGGDSFQNIFDLRSGALYEKENFQAKCNLCNQLIIGRRELAVHVRGVSHKNKLRKTDPEMAKADDLLPATSAKTSVKIEAKCDEDLVDKIKNIKKDSIDKDEEKLGDAKNGKKEKDFQDKKSVKEEKDQNDKKHKDKSKRNGKKDKERDESVSVKKEPVEMVYSRTSTGLAIKVPAMTSNSGSKLRSRTRSPLSQTRSKSRNRSGTRSRSRERKRRKSRSPVRRIPRSPTQFMRNSRRSRSRSPSHRRSRSPSHRRSRSRSRTPPRGSRKRRSSSEDKVKAFLARTRRSRSPANGYYSKRNRRSRTRSRSPQIAMKKDNREFHEKLALTADGKWNDEMEKRWKLMEADEAMFREQFYDHRKALIASPEEHSKYGEEWRQFWERRYQEVEQAGKDPDSYDYVTEWKEYWSKRLNSLLQDEADAKILQIKKTYGMDFASLNKLRNGNVSSAPTASAKTIVKTEVIEPKIEPKVPQSIPSGVKREAVGNVKAPGSGSDRLSLDDFGTKSMSISSGDFETDKNKDIKKPPERKPSVTVEDFKSKWELLTRQKVEEIAGSSLTDGLNIIPERQDSTNRILEKIENAAGSVISKRRPSKNRSEVTSSSEASYDFDGFDLVQVLRLMCKLEDQLSFLAPKVLEYFKMAEEMELAKSRGSHILLDNEELVTVLFQSRDRFMTMIRSNIVSKDVLKSLNLTVYALNAILDAPQCQKFRLNVPIMMIELEKPAPAATTLTTEIKEPEVLLPKIHQEKIEDKPAPVQTGSGVCHDIVAALINVPLEKKLSAASMITKFLLSHGRQSYNISDKALTDFVRTLLAPILQSARGNAESKASMDHHNQFRRNSAAGSKEFDIQQPPRYVAETLLNELESHSASSRLHGVTGSRVVGSALPALHSMSARAVEQHQRAPASYVEHHANEYDVYRTGSNTVPPKATSRQSPSPSGRRSPFSRRDYTGNPAANRGRL